MCVHQCCLGMNTLTLDAKDSYSESSTGNTLNSGGSGVKKNRNKVLSRDAIISMVRYYSVFTVLKWWKVVNCWCLTFVLAFFLCPLQCSNSGRGGDVDNLAFDGSDSDEDQEPVEVFHRSSSGGGSNLNSSTSRRPPAPVSLSSSSPSLSLAAGTAGTGTGAGGSAAIAISVTRSRDADIKHRAHSRTGSSASPKVAHHTAPENGASTPSTAVSTSSAPARDVPHRPHGVSSSEAKVKSRVVPDFPVGHDQLLTAAAAAAAAAKMSGRTDPIHAGR
jgi:hypothetical protein